MVAPGKGFGYQPVALDLGPPVADALHVGLLAQVPRDPGGRVERVGPGGLRADPAFPLRRWRRGPDERYEGLMLVRAMINHDDFGDGASTVIRLTGRTSPYPRPLHYAVVYSPHKCLRLSSFYRTIPRSFDRQRRVVILAGAAQRLSGGSGRLTRPSIRATAWPSKRP